MAMDKGEIYDVVSDVDGNFSPEFKKYVRDENLLCHILSKDSLFGGHLDVWLFRKEQQPDGVEPAHPDLTNNLIKMLETFSYVSKDCLFQFWRAEEVISLNDFGERRFKFTTRNQPFLISVSTFFLCTRVNEAICSYRTKMVDIVAGDGVIGRVFRNKRVEFTPNISYYSDKEYPRRDWALSCHIQGSLAIPLSDFSGCSVGVLEIVSDSNIYFYNKILCVLQDSNSLRYLPHCKDLCGQHDLEDEPLHLAMSEINKVIEEISGSCNLIFAETWMLCSRCDSLSNRERPDMDDSYLSTFGEEYICTLKKGEGVAGKAAISSHNLVYCEDVSQFNIADYPLAHFARLHELASCFAICLKSDLTGNQIYVLELFLNPRKVNGIGLTNTLLPIIEGMRQNFRTFKLASGEEIRDNLSVHVISQTVKIGGMNSMDKQHNHTQICNDEQVNVVGTSQQPSVQVNVVHTEKNIVGTSKERIINSSKLRFRRRGYDISLEELEQVSGMKRKDAAEMLNVSVSTFRRVCRDHNISRWPPRKRKIDHLSRSGDSAQTGSTKELRSSAPAVQNESFVTIKAKYGDSFIKFQLPTSSGMDTFHQQVSKRLKLEAGNYTVKYQDKDNDWILVACDEDLQDYISTSISLGNTTLTMLLEHI